MVYELQSAVPESLSPFNEQSLIDREKATTPVLKNEGLPADKTYFQPSLIVYKESFIKLLSELISAVKDDRMNTKRSVSADIASTARVQNQNDRIIDLCERELRRRDLTEDQRKDLINCMVRAAESTASANEASRSYQQEQLNHSHNLPLQILAGTTLMVLGGLGGIAIARARIK